jgi:hypothetical protein
MPVLDQPFAAASRKVRWARSNRNFSSSQILRVLATQYTRASGLSSKSRTPSHAIRPESSSGAFLTSTRSTPVGIASSHTLSRISCGHQAAISISEFPLLVPRAWLPNTNANAAPEERSALIESTYGCDSKSTDSMLTGGSESSATQLLDRECAGTTSRSYA